jgi:pimeloyl-ACP methyl ester carboxylesterase
LAAPFLAQTHRVLVYDRRGHSASSAPPIPGNLEQDVDDLEGLLEALGLVPAHVVGNSLGGIIALRLAARAPQKVSSLVVHEPPLLGLLAGERQWADEVADVQRRFAAVLSALEGSDPRGGAQLFIESIAMGKGAWQTLPSDQQETMTANAATFLDELQDPTALSFDPETLRDFHGVVRLTQGDASPGIFRRIMDRLARALPTAQRRVFSGAGHVPHLSHTAEWVQDVRETIQLSHGAAQHP